MSVFWGQMQSEYSFRLMECYHFFWDSTRCCSPFLMLPLPAVHRWDFTCVWYGALETPILNQTQTECLEEPSMAMSEMVTIWQEVLLLGCAHCCCGTERKILSANLSLVTLVILSCGKLFWGSWDKLIFCCMRALTEPCSIPLKATRSFLFPIFMLNYYFFDLFSFSPSHSTINVIWKTGFVSVRLAEKLSTL